MKLNEKMGVPLGIEKETDRIYNKILIEIESADFDNDDNEVFLGNYDISIEDMNLKNVPITIELSRIEGLPKPVLFGANVGTNFEYKRTESDIQLRRNGEGINFGIRIAINKDTTKFEIIELIKTDFSPSIISHELKHLYDHYKNPIESLESRSEYQSYQTGGFPPIISEFLHLLYYMTSTENSVRSSEMYKELLDNGVTKDNFMEYTKSSNIIKQVKLSESFSISKFRDNVNNDSEVEKMLAQSSKNGFNRSGDNYQDTVKLIFINISNNSIEVSKSIIGRFLDTEKIRKIKNSNPLDVLLFQHDKDTIDLVNNKFSKILKSYGKYEEDPEKYFEFLVKKLNLAGKKMKRKLYKLYDMTKNSEKIDNKSILNWELHNKINSKNEGIVYTLDFNKFKDGFPFKFK